MLEIKKWIRWITVAGLLLLHTISPAAATTAMTMVLIPAVEIHQATPIDSDISFHLSPAPVIAATTAPKNVILFIGDGMGSEQIRAAGMYQNGSPGTLFMESFPYSSTMTTHSAEAAVTDSAASATAMATGIKVTNGVLSQAWPGNGEDLETLAELFHRACKRVGLVTTTYATHATPAGFGAHEPSRYNYTQIAGDYLTQSKPDVLIGGGANGMSITTATLAGYTVVTDRVGMQALDPANVTHASGQFGNTHLPYEYSGSGYDTLPHLSEMVSTTLTLLNNDPDGFFLMVEGGRIDHAGHNNLLAENIFETLEFDHAVNVAYTWAMSRSDTLIIVTADHETGGLEILANNGAGNFPTVNWITTTRTSIGWPVWGWMRSHRVRSRPLEV